jgi:hypothetical protein
MSESIRLVKLTSGEEIICELVQDESGNVNVLNPCFIQIMDAGNKVERKATMKFVPYAPYAKDKRLVLSEWVWVAEPINEIADSYKRIFSPIILPDSQIIV